MKVRYEVFGGLIRIENPPVTIYVDKQYMRNLGFTDSELWKKERDYLSAPIDTHFAITNRCPMECKLCYKNSNMSEKDKLSLPEIKRIIDTLASMKVFSIAFGGGEPFSREDFFDIAKYAKSKYITPNVTTNGYYINSDNAKKCKVFGHIHISLELPGNNSEASKSRKASEIAIKAIDLLKNEGIHIGINYLITRENFNQLENVAEYCISKKIYDIALLRLKPIGRADEYYNKNKLTEEQNILLFKILRKLKRKYKISIQADCSLVPMLAYHKPSKKLLDFFGTEGCTGGNTFIEITEEGAVRSCSFSNYYGDHARNLDEIWDNSEYFVKYRTINDFPKEPCRTCKYLDICRGGCHVISEYITGDFNNPDPECPIVLKYNLKHQ